MSDGEKPLKIIVTGEREDLNKGPATARGRRLEWRELPVLRFERLPVEMAQVEKWVESPPDWIVFTSKRSVRFWSEMLVEAGLDFPLETQVACIGEATAEAAAQDGFNADFYPTEPGTEKFLEEFADLLSNVSTKPTVLLPVAEAGRPDLGEGLKRLGCGVHAIPLYRTVPREKADVTTSPSEVAEAGLVIFTSPSSVDAFLKHFRLPTADRVVSIGRYTADHLRKLGIASPKVLPGGDFTRIGEILEGNP